MPEEPPSPQTKTRFNAKNLKVVERCETQQRDFRAKITTAGRFTRAEQSALEIESRDAFKAFWEATLSDKNTFDMKHQQRGRRAATQVVSLSASAHDMLQSIDPLVNIIKDLGAPYGGMAIGTICFLLTVAKNRIKMQQQIGITLRDIQDRLPGVKMYQHIYNDDDTELGQQLQSKIVDAYERFIVFCIEASEFYSSRALTRWLSALMNPEIIQVKARSVQKAVVDVRRVSEELLNRNVSEVKRINLELQDNLYHERLENIRNDLGLAPYSPETHHALLDRHKRDVDADFGRYDDSEPRSYSIVEKDPAFREWRCSKTSRLLLLSGRNEVLDAPHCWLSPVALNMMIHFTDPAPMNDSRDFCVFYIFGLHDEDEPFTHVLAFFIYRLLCYNKQALRLPNVFDELKASLGAYVRDQAGTGKFQRGSEEHLEAILLRVLNSFPVGHTVWLILDRVDKCQTDADMKMHRRALLKVLSRMVERSEVRLMVLAVVNTRDWDVEQFITEIQGEEYEARAMLLTYDEEEALSQL